MVQVLWGSSAGTAPAVGPGRCLRGDDPRVLVRARGTRQLRVDGDANEGWPPQVQGLPRGHGRLGRDARRVVTRCAASASACICALLARRATKAPAKPRIRVDV